ncbi:beta-galactosidase [Saccharicrinis fermentans]|uniref:Beta-galactosidase n=1 Tax=Saccharicrinis fermentans DSM 9555 = JCM 21142 TaxID=869213 RepID=W7Y2I1_9BACT|nr:beta-galactosidase [Saccharicrinis fermentans]GAF02157.1 beta-galactosidase [Saccharicrinis fermentans DSM 9555 = JCM 21142]
MKVYRLLLSTAMVFCFSLSVFSQSLNSQAEQKIKLLKEQVAKAEKKGLPVEREKMTLCTAQTYLTFADWDEENVVANTKYFKLVSIYKDQAEEMAQKLADWERNDVIKMLDSSIITVQKVLRGEIVRKETPKIDWARVKHEGDLLTFNGRPVFVADYTWKQEDSNWMEYYGAQDGFFLTPSYVINKKGDINPAKLTELRNKPDGRLGFIFINNKNVPDWAEKAYGPGFKMREDTYTNYDIDNPGARKMMGALIKGTVPYMAGKKYSELGYMLCNEPHFYTTTNGDKLDWASGPVSEFTIAKFKKWLKKKHQTIAVLNSLWKTDFASFDELKISIPIDIRLQGTAQWYDWILFNNDRVTQWYSWLKSEILRYDPSAKVHLKIMPNLWSDNKRGHGIDLEALTNMSQIIGNDAGAAYNKMWGPTQDWEHDYSFDWREMCMSYDFLKSVSPDKIIFNSEAHYLSTGRSRDLYMNPQYARATFWQAHVQGLSASQIWYWPRKTDGSLNRNPGKGYGGSNNQQPRVLNEVTSTLMDLNSFSEEIVLMQRQRKPIRIFYSETSAINKSDYMDGLFALYEHVFFEGVPIGFATENIINKQNHNDWDMILVRNTEFVTQTELDALQAYADQGGTVIVDDESLKKNEYGIAMPGLIGKHVQKASSIDEYKNKAFALLDDNGGLPEIEVKELKESSKKVCAWKCVKDKDGKLFLSVVNLGKDQTKIHVSYRKDGSDVTGTDLFTGRKVMSEISLEKYGVAFIQIESQLMPR